MVSPRRRFGSERIVILVGVCALALAPLCANAQPSYWPIRKRIRRPYATDRVEVYTAASSTQKLVFESDDGTEIIADSAVVKNELDAGGHASGGISARIKDVEDDLEALRIAYNAISFDSLNSAKTDCDTKLTDFTSRVAALESAVASPAIIPVQCDAAGVAGLRRELNNGVLEWTCPCVNNYTSSATDTCDIASCELPSTVVSDTHIVQNCAETHLKAGAVCEFSCEDGYQPTGLTSDTAGQITCGASGGTPTSTATSCTACTNSFTGVNCRLESCDLTANGFNGDTNTVDTGTNDCPAQYMTAGSSCDYDCATGYMPSGETAVDTTGTITCAADGGTTTPAAPACVTCDAAGKTGYTGVNCRQEPCDLTSIFTAGSPIANFLAGDCPTGSYLQADGTCNFDCEAGYMPVGVSNTGAGSTVTRGTLTCSNDGGTTTDDSGTTVTSSSALCQTCSSVQYSGKNCGLDSCDITSVLAKTGVVNLDCHDTVSSSTYLAADANCFYDCTNSMPIAATAHDTSGVINCAGTGAVTGDDGITPTSSGEFCQSCADGGFPGYKGTNCEYEACDLSLLTFTDDVNFNNIDCPTTTYMEASDTCTFNCAAGYMPVGGTRGSPGQLTCSSDNGNTSDDANTQLTGSVTLCTACTSQYSGQNCQYNSCPTTLVLAKTNVTNVDCDASYLAAGATCTYNCADGSMPIGATQTGQSGTIACAATGATVGNVGITPSGTEACQSCAAFGVPGNTGVNCATAPQQGGTN